ncbi:UNVERIFIED_CONTAM: hypothetical protein GTU68_033778, partial [Idotea baltica]|nr:hypothetical protein [Idotea baltica]
MSKSYEIGSVVWVRLGQKWWPGRVAALDECPLQFTATLKKDPLAIVKFFNESGFHDVTKQEHIFSYNC